MKNSSNGMELSGFELSDAGLPEPNSGSLSFSASGGMMPYTFTLSDTLHSDSPLFENLLPGNYGLYVTDALGCYADTSIHIATQLSASVIDDAGISLFPNPASDFVHFSTPEPGELKIFTTDGKLVARISMQDKGIEIIPVATFPAGVYLAEFIGRSGKVTNSRIVLN
ncbi:MAG: T9SS type A sorting domain-containing protein [Bacteroidia bacterium]